MTVDAHGNLYTTPSYAAPCDNALVNVYDSKGNELEGIEVPESPTNVCRALASCVGVKRRRDELRTRFEPDVNIRRQHLTPIGERVIESQRSFQ